MVALEKQPKFLFEFRALSALIAYFVMVLRAVP
jgi:hypothetical protein